MTAAAVLTQLAAIESSLGLKEGTLHNPGETGGCRAFGLHDSKAASLPGCRVRHAAPLWPAPLLHARTRSTSTHPPPSSSSTPLRATAGAAAGTDVLTLTGWAALAGVFALAALVLSLVVYGARRALGLGGGASRRGYTLVVKQELAAVGGHASPGRGGAGAGGAGLPRRHG